MQVLDETIQFTIAVKKQTKKESIHKAQFNVVIFVWFSSQFRKKKYYSVQQKGLIKRKLLLESTQTHGQLEGSSFILKAWESMGTRCEFPLGSRTSPSS